MFAVPHFLSHLFHVPSIRRTHLIILSLIVTACGGGGGGGTVVGGGGIGGTGSVASVGTVSAIGSVTVNGVTFSCVGATVTKDDETIDQGPGDNCIAAQTNGNLSVGSVVVVQGNNSGGTFTATTVSSSNQVFGPVANVSVTGLSFTVLSQTILVDDATRFEINGVQSTGTGALSSLAGKTVEVSGFRNANGAILATLVETKSSASSEFELKGIVAGSPSAVTIGGVSIILGTQPAPTNGACVEAKGSWNGTTLTLTQPLKSDDDCNGGSVSGNFVKAEVEGVIGGINAAQDQFNVGSQPVSANAATIEGGLRADLLNGVKVEAEGPIVNGTLVATKVLIKSNGVRIEGVTDTGLSNGSFTILGITVRVITGTDNQLGSIAAGTRLRLEGSKSGASQVNAAKITNASGGGGGTRTELRGPLDANPVVGSFKILGVQVNTGGATFQNLSGGSISEATFVANTKANDIVKAKGTESPDNQIAATEIENED
jgi:Domain of unknown function (DUF5666)